MNHSWQRLSLVVLGLTVSVPVFAQPDRLPSAAPRAPAQLPVEKGQPLPKPGSMPPGTNPLVPKPQDDLLPPPRLVPQPGVPGQPGEPGKDGKFLPGGGVPKGKGQEPTPPLPELPPLPPLAGRPTDDQPDTPLELREVVESVELHYPLLAAIEQERTIAGGQLLSSLGSFDLRLNSLQFSNSGTFPHYRSDYALNQLTPFGGASLFAGYRQGLGSFPDYEGKAITGEGGELRAGVRLPLLRDRAIDRARANVAQAQITRQIAEPTIETQRIAFLQAATKTYYTWIGAGLRVKLVEQLLDQARLRSDQIADRVRAGATPLIDHLDNQQTIAARQALLVSARRLLQRATIELSLFYRDSAGNPILVSEKRLPPSFPVPLIPRLDEYPQAAELALQQRPEIRLLRLQYERLLVELRLQENQLLPGLNAVIGGAQDMGLGKKDLDRSNFFVEAGFDLPLQRRDARGKILAIQGQLSQIAERLRFARDTILANVQDTLSALDQAYELREQAALRLKYVKQVEEGEVIRFELAGNDLLRVLLRELATFDARLTLLDAEIEYFRSLADYQAALGIGAYPAPPFDRNNPVRKLE